MLNTVLKKDKLWKDLSFWYDSGAAFYTLAKSCARQLFNLPKWMVGAEGDRVIPVTCDFTKYLHISNPSGFAVLLQRALFTASYTNRNVAHSLHMHI